MTDTTLHELCKGFGALLSRSKVSTSNEMILSHQSTPSRHLASRHVTISNLIAILPDETTVATHLY